MSKLMSAIGPKRTSLAAPHMSAFGGKADIEASNGIAKRKAAADGGS
jgi:hypothetical protein